MNFMWNRIEDALLVAPGTLISYKTIHPNWTENDLVMGKKFIYTQCSRVYTVHIVYTQCSRVYTVHIVYTQ